MHMLMICFLMALKRDFSNKNNNNLFSHYSGRRKQKRKQKYDATDYMETYISGDTEDKGNNLPGETVNILTLNNSHQLIKVVIKCWY